MESMYAQHHDVDGVVTGREEVPATVKAKNVSPAAPTQAPMTALAAPVNRNQHSLVLSQRGMSFDGMSSESRFVAGYSLEAALEEYKHGDSNCLALRYHGGGVDVIFSIHGGASSGAFKRAKFIVRHEGTEGQTPITRRFIVDLSERTHKWILDVIGQIMERMSGETSGQMYDTISTFCSAVCSNSIPPPPPLINYNPTGRSASITSFTMKENSLDEYPSWINLPADCCRLIRDRLDAFATLSFPFVCKTWAKVYAEKRRLQPGAPTLLTSPSLGGGWEHPSEGLRGIFFIQNIILPRDTFFVEVNNFRYSRWIGGKDEWLVTVDIGCSYKLWNPITGACTLLVPEDVRTPLYIERIQLCQTPDEANGYFAIAIAFHQLAYTMAGSDQWILLENPDEPPYHMRIYADAVLHRGRIVAICSDGNLWSWDLDGQGGNPKQLFRSTVYSERGEVYDFILAPSLNNDNLLIVNPYGKSLPLGIERTVAGNSRCRNQCNFCVDGVVLHEVDIDAESMKDVHGIGDRALFLGPNYPFYVPVLVPSGDLKTNHVYITDISNYDVVAINLGEDNLPDKVTLIDYNGPASNIYQVPMWFRPAFPGRLR